MGYPVLSAIQDKEARRIPFREGMLGDEGLGKLVLVVGYVKYDLLARSPLSDGTLRSSVCTAPKDAGIRPSVVSGNASWFPAQNRKLTILQ